MQCNLLSLWLVTHFFFPIWMLKMSYNHKYSHDYCKVIPSGVVPYSKISKAEYLSVRSSTIYTGKRRSPWKSVLLITKAGRHLWRSSSPALCSAHSRVTYSRLLRNMSSLVLTILPTVSPQYWILWSSIWPLSQWSSFPLCLNGVSCISVSADCAPCHFTGHCLRVWFNLLYHHSHQVLIYTVSSPPQNVQVHVI